MQLKHQMFSPVSLSSLGVIWYLGHGGQPCRSREGEGTGTWENIVTNDESRAGEHGEIEESYDTILIVDSSGLSHHLLHYCTCASAESPLEQLLKARLFPSTTTRIATAFTFSVLDEYLLDSTECKISTYAFWQKLRRRTRNAFPEDVPVGNAITVIVYVAQRKGKNRYRELLRVGRCWRDLKVRMWHGVGFDKEDPPSPMLALFCPSCPQPCINLPERWEQHPKQWVDFC